MLVMVVVTVMYCSVSVGDRVGRNDLLSKCFLEKEEGGGSPGAMKWP